MAGLSAAVTRPFRRDRGAGQDKPGQRWEAKAGINADWYKVAKRTACICSIVVRERGALVYMTAGMVRWAVAADSPSP
jgi:hypothetical protein